MEYLKPKQEQRECGCSEKPNCHGEWSKEDEKKIDDIIRIICDTRECSKIANIGEEKEFDSSFYNELVLFLKKHFRPQPHWKPSEEQMEALLNTEGLVRANNYPENAKILALLYEDLKKL